MPKQVVIIGGGLSSKHAAEVLLKKGKKEVEVTIIQANRFAEWPLAMPICLVQPERHIAAIAPNPKTFEVPGVTYKYGVVQSVDLKAKEVQGSDGMKVAYDSLIVATGFQMPLVFPGLGVTLAERMTEVRNVGEAIKNGKCIVVAGGGPVGLEISGNIRGLYPDKKVVLLCKSGVLGQWPQKHQQKVENRLQKMNIEVMKGDTDAPKVHSVQPGTIKFSDKELQYDVFIPAYSQGPNTGFLPVEIVDGTGCVDVNEYLQSKVNEDVFAIGVSSAKEGFIGMPKLESQWLSVVGNVIASATGKPLKKHKEGMPFMKLPPLLTIGQLKNGYGFLDFNNVPPPIKCCCCGGLGGFPCCPPCWPCLGCCGCGCCPCGYCCGPPEGSGPSKLSGKMAFMSSGMHFKGMGEAPAQQTMN